MTSIADLRDALAAWPDAALAVSTGQGALRPGFHVTEVRRAEISALDCGRGVETWREVVLEMVDGPRCPGRPMAAGKLDAILREAGAGDDPKAQAVIEVGHPALARHDLAGLRREGDVLWLDLAPRGARCKAAERAGCC